MYIKLRKVFVHTSLNHPVVLIYILLHELQPGIFIFIYDCKTVRRSRLPCKLVCCKDTFYNLNNFFDRPITT